MADLPHVADQPRHPETDTDTDVVSDSDSSATRSRGRFVFWIVSILFVVLFVGLHLTGVVGPGAH